MKRFFYSVLAAATMLFATTSCSQEEEIVNGGSESGKTQKVTFKVEMPGEAASRAIADGVDVGYGNMANTLRYALYEVDDKGIAITGSPLKIGMVEESSDKNFTVNIDMVKGLKYKILFLAYNNDKDKCIFKFEEKNYYGDENPDGDDLLTLDLKEGLLSNQESYDAFVACHPYAINDDNRSNNVTLYRPFAQINLGTTDIDLKKAADLKATVTASQLVIKNVPTRYNVFDGKVSNNDDVTYTKSTILYQTNSSVNEKLYGVDGKNYNYLNMVYVLAGNEAATSSTHTVEYTLYRDAAPQVVRSFEIENLPIERNFRTNIVGDILTQTESFNIIIDEGFVGDRNTEDGITFKGEENTYYITSEEGLQNFVEQVNAGNTDMLDANITLDGDIDLSTFSRNITSNWTPIGTEENPYTGTFDGNGHTIKNLTLVEPEAKEGKAYIGFFGYAKNATIKNVTFENVYINIPCLDIDHSQGHIGAVAGSLEGTSTIENVTVKGDIQVYATKDANGASRVAVVAGGNAYGDVTMKNVHVIANEGSYLTANNNTGALAGQLQGKMYFENCSSNIDVTVNKFFAGGLVGIAAGDSKFVDCHTTGDVAVVAGRAGRANDHYRVGGIAGGWADGKTKVCTLENCSYTGNVSGTNADGSVAEVLDYDGYVGRGYTLTNCAGSTVIIDGTTYVQMYEDKYGIYAINGLAQVSTDGELVDALNAGYGVQFLNDITIAATKGGYSKAGILQNNAQTIDGNGHTLTVTGAGATWDCAIYTNGGTIKNLTVAGAMRGIFTAGQKADLNIENVVFKNVIYTFNSDGKMPANPYGVYVSNSTVNGWTSHSDMHTEVVYTNCSFGEGSGYAFCRPYGKTSFVNCTFCNAYEVDKSKTNDITFTDCTWEE